MSIEEKIEKIEKKIALVVEGMKVQASINQDFFETIQLLIENVKKLEKND